MRTKNGMFLQFQFTHPGRGATHLEGFSPRAYIPFQFTHPGRGATCHTLIIIMG